MIQLMPNAYAHQLHLTSADAAARTDEAAFLNWLSRRDTARQQIRRLSRRELQVVQLVTNGLANKSIAVELVISVKTIEKHRANAARKLGVGSTAEMVRITVLADHEVEVQNRIPVADPNAARIPVAECHTTMSRFNDN